MARKRTGTVLKTKDGRWQAVITLNDGSTHKSDTKLKLSLANRGGNWVIESIK